MDKPNFLIIMADQLTPFMLGCYGNMQVKTPNIDKLSEQGIQFNKAYTPNPLCTPARAAFMTSRYTYDLCCYDNAQSFSPSEPTFAHYLNLKGYETVLSGKMHFIGPDQLHGFSKRLTTDIYPSDYSFLPHMINEKTHLMQDPWGNAICYQGDHLKTEEWTEFINYDEETHFRAKEYLYNLKVAPKSERKPFCLCVSYHNPHDPFFAPKKYFDLYEDTDFDIPDIDEFNTLTPTIMDKWLNNGFHRVDKYKIDTKENLKKLRKCYAALVSFIDDKVGDLLAHLEYCGFK